MNIITKLISLAALAVTTVPCVLYFMDIFDHDAVKLTALIGTIMWFIATPLWMGRELPIDAKEVEI